MKRCVYCGVENPDDALMCAGCGRNQFASGINPAAALPARSPRRTDTLIRLLVATGAGLVIFAISVFVAWQNSGQLPAIRFPQLLTQSQLTEIKSAIDRYRWQSNEAPHSLSQLRRIFDGGFFQSEKGGDLEDGWGRPFLSSYDGTNLVVLSYGQDGKPGGVGLDGDLSTADRGWAGTSPTLGQFLRGSAATGMVVSCLVCAWLGFMLTLFLVRETDFTQRRLDAAVIKVGATILGAVIVAAIMSVLHIPSGH